MARLGALASDQSRPTSSRMELEQKLDQLTELYLSTNGKEKVTIQRPSYWGGYRLLPHTVEFWKGRASRIHDRIKYIRTDIDHKHTTFDNSTWKRVRLQP